MLILVFELRYCSYIAIYRLIFDIKNPPDAVVFYIRRTLFLYPLFTNLSITPHGIVILSDIYWAYIKAYLSSAAILQSFLDIPAELLRLKLKGIAELLLDKLFQKTQHTFIAAGQVLADCGTLSFS